VSTKSADIGQRECEANEFEFEASISSTSSTLSVRSDHRKPEEARSDGTLCDFKQRTAHRVKLRKRKLRDDERQELRAVAEAEQKRMSSRESAKTAMESAQKRVIRRQSKRDEDSERLSEFVREERENYRRKQKERERLKTRAAQHRARIYALNYLCRKKYELRCQQKEEEEDVTERTTKTDSDRELDDD